MSGLRLFNSAQPVPEGVPLPSSSQDLVNLCAMYLAIRGGGAFNGINYGSNTPAPQNRSLPWFKTDVQGNPVGFYSWNGSAWVPVPTIVANGPTGQRPASPSPGTVFYDTTIGAQIIFNGGANDWTTVGGVVGDVKEVTFTDLPTALANNPGWKQHTDSTGCVIGAAGDAASISAAHTAGTTIGEETHKLVVSELAAHVHVEIYGTFPGAFQNGSQDPGVSPAVTPGSSSVQPASTQSAGGDAAHNNIQPTMYLYRLVKYI